MATLTSAARRPPLTRWLPRAMVAVLVVGPPLPVPAQVESDSAAASRLEEYRIHLERMTRDGSWWWASNAEYLDSDGPGTADAFGVRLWSDPGGVSAAGCLWSVVDGAPPTVVWTLHEGWDAAAGRAFVYQAHTSGTGTGMGWRLAPVGGISVVEQDFRWSDGSIQRIRHEESWLGEDRHRGASLLWIDGGWSPSRSYTWERRTDGATAPCGPGAPDSPEGRRPGR